MVRIIEKELGQSFQKSLQIDAGLQELEETAYWLEILVGSKIMPEKLHKDLFQEINELTAILVTFSKNTKAKKS